MSAPPTRNAVPPANTQIDSQCGAHRGVAATIAASTPMLPMTTPAVPGTTIEPDISMDVRMNASVPSARVSIETGTVGLHGS